MNDPEIIEPTDDVKIIQKHLENVNMDPWYYIYQVYVNPSDKTNKKIQK